MRGTATHDVLGGGAGPGRILGSGSRSQPLRMQPGRFSRLSFVEFLQRGTLVPETRAAG